MAVIDLGFANIEVKENGFSFVGKKKGGNSKNKEIPPVQECFFSITPRRLMEFLSEAMLFARLNKEEESNEENEENREEKKTKRTHRYFGRIRGREVKTTEENEETGENQEGQERNDSPGRYSCYITSTKRSGSVAISVVKMRNNSVVQRSSGIILPHATLAVITEAFDRIWDVTLRSYKSKNPVPFIYPLGVASIFMDLKFKDSEAKSKVVLVSGSERMELDTFRKRELSYILTSYLLDEDYTFNFRTRRMGLMGGGKEKPTLFFDREKTQLNPLDVVVIWAVCSR